MSTTTMMQLPGGPAAPQKVTARHLQRQAMLYVRQSTLHQVVENTESTARQYALRNRALALGWDAARIVVIDQDLGQSGASPGPLRSTARASNAWSLRWAWARWNWSWVWRCPV